MREYLYELRLKHKLKQEDVIERIYRRYGVSIRYGCIERGQMWAKIDESRAEMLAFGLHTTAADIIEKEHKFGGYTGEGSIVDTSHRVDVQKVYPLSDTERQTVEEYYPWASKIISILSKNDFAWTIRDKLLTSEDFYDIGMRFLIDAVRDMLTMTPDGDAEHLYKAVVSRRIRDGIRSAVRDAKAKKRIANALACSIDTPLTDGSDTLFADAIPSNDIPVDKQCEDRLWFLHLFSWLTDKQKEICCCLLAGYSVQDVLRLGYSETDVQKVRFYVKQIRQYGKIHWSVQEYRSGEKGVYFDVKYNAWKVEIHIAGKKYRLHRYEDLITAISCKKIAEYHLAQNDFQQWYDRHAENGQFTFPLDEDDELMNCVDELLDEEIKGRHTISIATLDNPVGCSYRAKPGLWEVTVSGKYIGRRKTLEEAVALRNKAAGISEPDSRYVILDYTVISAITMYTLCLCGAGLHKEVYRTTDIDIACEVMELSNQHIDVGDYDDWFDAYKERKM